VTRKTTLIVDDERANRDLIVAMLEAEDMNLVTAADGLQVLASVAEKLPDLILLDVMLPGMNGIGVLRRLRGDPATADIPIIMITALDDHDSRTRVLESGADEVLTKPISAGEALLCVKNMLRIHEAA